MGETGYREAAIEEYGEECQNCGAEENIDVHHVDGDYENNDIENLLPLCRQCHQLVHSGNEEVSHLVEKLPDDNGSTRPKTRVTVYGDTLDRLYDQKSRGESYDELVNRILDDWEVDDA